MRQLRDLWEELNDALFKHESEATFAQALDNMSNRGDKLGDAIQEENWDEVYEILGGTDLDKRAFDNAVDEEYKNCLTVETHQADEDDEKIKDDGPILKEPMLRKVAGRGELWYFTLNVEGEEVYDSRTDNEFFPSEEDADDAGSNCDVAEWDSLSDHLQEKIVDRVKEELTKEYQQYVSNETSEVSALDETYDGFRDELLAELEAIFQKEYPDTWKDHALAELRKGWGKAVGVVRKATQPVVKFANKIRRAATAAKQEFNKESLMTATELVSQLLGEEIGPSSAKTIGTDGDDYKVVDFKGRLYIVGHGKRIPVQSKEDGELEISRMRERRKVVDKNQKGKDEAAAIHKFDKA
jgi:hypothetical protein